MVGKGRPRAIQKVPVGLIDGSPLLLIKGFGAWVTELNEGPDGSGKMADFTVLEDRERGQTVDPFADGELSQLFQVFGEERLAVFLKKVEFHGPDQGHFEFGHLPRLGDVAIDAPVVHGIDGGIDVGIGGGKDPLDRWFDPGGLLEKLGSRFIGHPLVGHDDSDVIDLFLEKLHGFDSVRCGDNAETGGEKPGEVLTGLRLVIDEENGWKFIWRLGNHKIESELTPGEKEYQTIIFWGQGGTMNS